ncbi:olfactory receptor 11H6-like [Enoplosus armatus]|uniref:olfactory receptor 11H6-like n=1 Tax=Enoplosus armatus TaxID=215367 RepID=UPI0039914E56
MIDNVSLITMFVLSGLNETRNHRFILFSLTLLCYCVILLVNICLIVTIILDKNLHDPMYILLCTFCMNGLYGTAGFYPKFLWDLLSPVHVISYSGCLVQALVMYSFACSDMSILSVMAYDRYVAICRPLEYHSIMSKPRLFKLVCFSWLTPFCIIGINIFVTSRLKLCSPYIARLFCVNWIIVKLACFPAQTTVNGIVAYITIIMYVFNGVFIVWSYMYLIKTCVNSIENRAKFMQTCVPHLIALLIFVVTILFDVMSMRFGSKDLPQIFQNVVAVEFLVIPPIMNPLIYGFKLTKIRNRIVQYLGQRLRQGGFT